MSIEGSQKWRPRRMLTALMVASASGGLDRATPTQGLFVSRFQGTRLETRQLDPTLWLGAGGEREAALTSSQAISSPAYWRVTLHGKIRDWPRPWKWRS